MTTAEITELESDFMTRSRDAKAAGDHLAAAVWSNAASLLIQAESRSITASYVRSQKRTARKSKSLGLRLTR